MLPLALAALVGVLHVHHAPSHDSDAALSDVLEGAMAARLDFLVLTEHAPPDPHDGPLPAAQAAGLYPYPGAERSLLVLVGVELATRDGHLLALDVPRLVPAQGRAGRDVIADIHALGGFAVVPHPFTHGGWHDWEAPFDGFEVHNHASELRRLLGPLLPFRLIWLALDRRAVIARMLDRPHEELERWEQLLASGRRVVAFSGADSHQNVSLFGWQLDAYRDMFPLVRMRCPEGPLEEDALWRALRSGRCHIHYALHAGRAAEASEVSFPSGRVELQLDSGERVLEIRNPIIVLR